MTNQQNAPPIESQLVRRLLGGQFALTAEVTPPVSAGSDELLAKAEPLRGIVDAVNWMIDSSYGTQGTLEDFFG